LTYRIDGKRVKKKWYFILRAAEEDVDFRLNSGNRTMPEQQVLYDNQPPLAAFPNPNAPHIQEGSDNHALDVDMFYGDGVQGLASWLRKHGANPRWTVPGEGWHIEITDNELDKLYRKFSDDTPTLKPGSRGEAVSRVQRLLNDRGFKVKVDGYYGKQLADAVRRVYRAYGYAGHDHVGDAMWQILLGKHPWRYLTAEERKAAATLEAERRIARRAGGWNRVDSSHLRNAEEAKDFLRRANLRLHEAAKDKKGWTKARRTRHAIIHKLI
jgi:hypothetical protein